MDQPQPPFATWARANAGSSRTALEFPDRTVRWDELATAVERAAAALRGAGVEPGHRVGLWAAPSFEIIAVILGLARLGSAPVPFDPRMPDSRVDLRIGVCGAAHFLATLRWPSATHPIEPDHLFDPAGPAAPVEEPTPEAEAAVVFTSGSSGAPRGVVLSAANVEAAVAASRERIGNGPEDRWLLTLPLWHVGGLSILWRSAAVGGTVVVAERFDPATVARAIREGEVTVLSLVPTMLRRLLELDPGPYPGVRAVLLGGAHASPALVARGLDAGLPILSTYGMTEACSQITTVVPGTERQSLGTVGEALRSVTIEIRDLDERPVHAGEVGEIVVAGPTVSPGYAGEAPRTGPLYTGDLGRLDEAGRLVVMGRRDDMIITGGENVQPAVVEAAIERHGGVRAVVVFGIPDDEWGSIVAAAVVPSGAFPGRDTMGTFLAGRLGPYEIPKRWLVLDRLPLLANGKVDTQLLVALASAGSEAPDEDDGAGETDFSPL